MDAGTGQKDEAKKIRLLRAEEIECRVSVICPAGLCAAKILLYHLIAASAPIRRWHGPFHHMVIPEIPASAYNADKWSDGDIPLHYVMQCHHYMAVTGKRVWYIAALILGQGFVYRKLEWDDCPHPQS